MNIKIRPVDSLFSRFIRSRDKWTCRRCKTKYPEGARGLHNSHYWGRGKESTRFEPDNCIALCYGCHQIWGHGDGRDLYKDYMIELLGQNRFDTLMVQAHTYKKKDDKLMMLYLKELMKSVDNFS